MQIDATMWQQLTEQVHEAQERFHVPAAAVCLFLDGREYTAGYGITSVERGLAIGVMTNADLGARLHGDVTKWALDRFLGIAGLDPVPDSSAAENAAQYAGRYRHWYGLDVTLETRGGELVTGDPPIHLAFCAPERVFVLDGPSRGERGQFLRDEQGEICAFRFFGRLGARVH